MSDMPLICFGPGWFRVFGYGLSFLGPQHPACFSERNKIGVYLRVGFGWRIKWLPFPKNSWAR